MLGHAETPLARIQVSGFPGASIADLLALALATGPDEQLDAELRARELLRAMGSANAIADVSLEQIRVSAGVDVFRASQCLAWMEIGRKSWIAGKGNPETVMSPENVVQLLKHLRREKREHFVVILLDAKNVVLRWTTIHIGTLTMSVVGPREVFREAVREGASSIIVAHNHPSGDPEPSPEDILITKKLEEIGQMLDIRVWDHIVIGEMEFVSLRQRGHFTK